MEDKFCPCCGRSCPLTNPCCERGTAYAQSGSEENFNEKKTHCGRPPHKHGEHRHYGEHPYKH